MHNFINRKEIHKTRNTLKVREIKVFLNKKNKLCADGEVGVSVKPNSV